MEYFLRGCNRFNFLFCLFFKKKYNVANLDPNNIFESILDKEINNGLPKEICENYKIRFKEKLKNFNIEEYYNNDPFLNSCNALYQWAPIADELKELDKEIVINSIKNKWMLVTADLEKITVNLK